MTLGENLQLMRKRNDLTQREVWQRTGIHYKTISNWENDVAKPSPDDLKTLSKLYHVSTDILLGIDPIFKAEGYYPIIERDTNEKQGYYLDEETARIANEMKENPGRRVLFDATRNLSPEKIKQVKDFVGGPFSVSVMISNTVLV